MTFKQAIKQIIRGDKPLIDVWHYLVGNYRYWLWYARFPDGTPARWLIRKHIREQITYRILWMNRECYANGECVKCGCMTTQLQMCNKACDGLCYPTMMGKGEWGYYKVGGTYKDKYGVWTPELSKDNKPTLI